MALLEPTEKKFDDKKYCNKHVLFLTQALICIHMCACNHCLYTRAAHCDKNLEPLGWIRVCHLVAHP